MKKTLILGIAAVILLTTVSGSIAFFTDSVAANGNVIASGDLKISQDEWERTTDDHGNAVLGKFTNNQPLYPAVKPTNINRTTQTYTYADAKGNTLSLNLNMPDKSFLGYVDKIVTVQNTGSLPVYVRTFIAVPAAGGTEWLHLDRNTSEWSWSEPPLTNQTVKVNDTEIKCNIYVATLNNPLEPGATSAPSLLGFYLDSEVTNKNGSYTFNGAAIAKDTLSIRIKTEATQADIYKAEAAIVNPAEEDRLSASEALDSVFGAIIPEEDSGNLPHHPWEK